jgi:hypothetical protein
MVFFIYDILMHEFFCLRYIIALKKLGDFLILHLLLFYRRLYLNQIIQGNVFKHFLILASLIAIIFYYILFDKFKGGDSVF